MRNDITDRRDVILLVNTFYDKVKSDPLIGKLFSRVTWDTHLPVMYSFWSSMMLGEASYRGNPLQKHLPLPLEKEHFERWLALWMETVDELFKGDRAEEIKMRAQSIAGIFQVKMGLPK